MTFNWSKIIDWLINARYDFPVLLEKFKTVFSAVLKDGDVAALLDLVKGTIAPVLVYLPYVLLALCVVETFLGKKLLGLQKFLLMFGLGFSGGVIIVSPLLDSLFVIPSYITGAVVGLVCAILYKILYWILYAGVFGYATYMFCFAGAYLPVVTQYTKGNLLYSVIAAAVVILVTILLHKYIEMLGTSLLGAFGIVSIVIKDLYDFTALVPGAEMIVKLVVIGVVALIGFIVQFKTRKRYY